MGFELQTTSPSTCSRGELRSTLCRQDSWQRQSLQWCTVYTTTQLTVDSHQDSQDQCLLPAIAPVLHCSIPPLLQSSIAPLLHCSIPPVLQSSSSGSVNAWSWTCRRCSRAAGEEMWSRSCKYSRLPLLIVQIPVLGVARIQVQAPVLVLVVVLVLVLYCTVKKILK